MRIRKAWDNAFAAADELARALDGIVTDDHSLEVHYDGHDEAEPAADREQLETWLSLEFDEPDRYFVRLYRQGTFRARK